MKTVFILISLLCCVFTVEAQSNQYNITSTQSPFYVQAVLDSRESNFQYSHYSLDNSFILNVSYAGSNRFMVTVGNNTSMMKRFGTITIYYRSSLYPASGPYGKCVVNITQGAALLAGYIKSDISIANFGSSARIDNVTGASGGTMTSYYYSWEKKDQTTGNWQPMSFTPIDPQNRIGYIASVEATRICKTEVRRKVVCGTETAYSNICTISCYLTGGSISERVSASDSNIVTIYNKANTTGGWNNIYSWEAYNGSAWSTIPGQLEMTSCIIDFAITQPLKVRRKVYSQYTYEMSYSNESIIDRPLLGGVISGDQTITIDVEPSEIYSIEGAAGGNGSVCIYSWEFKHEETTWTLLSNSSYANYTPKNVMSRTYYRRKATQPSSGLTAYSNSVKVEPIFHPGKIYYDERSGRIKFLKLPIGSIRPYDYYVVWQKSFDNTSWTELLAGQDALNPQDYAKYRAKVTVNKSYGVDVKAAYTNEIEWSGRHNYIRETTYIDDSGSSVSDINYFDELGREIQRININASPRDEGGDIVSPIEYDPMGRSDAKIHLPYVSYSNNGIYRINALQEQGSYYRTLASNSDNTPYAENIYEPSPLNIVTAHVNVGDVFRQNENTIMATFAYNVNKANEVKQLKVSCDTLIFDSYYPVNMLVKRTQRDEDNKETITFTDKSGRVILERVVDDRNDYCDTYYVYDNKGRLCWVLPPEAVNEINSQRVAPDDDKAIRLCYIYMYDGVNRLIAKKLPGADWVHMVYDKANRLVLTQDGNQRLNNAWAYFVYDDLNRAVEQSIVISRLDRDAVQSHYNLSTFDNSYSASSDTSNILVPDIPGFTFEKHLACTRYGGYSYLSINDIPLDLVFLSHDASVIPEGTLDQRTKSLKTYEKVAVLGGCKNAEPFVERAFFYDYRGRVIQIVEKNHLGGISRYSTKYDFAGNVLKTCERHTFDVDLSLPDYNELEGTSYQKLTEFTYDHRGRMLTEKTTLDNHEPVMIAYTYDQLGRLKGKTYGDSSVSGSASGSQVPSEVFDYNIQGWLVEKSSPYFDMKLRYFDPKKPDSTPSYTGNISEWEWTHKSSSNGPDVANTYAFIYDKLSRLADSKQYVDGVFNAGNVEKGLTYDLNGNIKTLQRYASGTLSDDFTYAYSGNLLASISGTTSGSYTYDANGNMMLDGLHNLSLTYNHLNLTEKVIENEISVANYSYLTDGTKLSATNAAENGLCYLGSLVYAKQNGTIGLESASFSGGRIVALQTSGIVSYEPRYFVSDHLGSVRTVIDARGEELERSDYYPFGMRWTNADAAISDNRYRYNGKEEQGFLNIPYSDYGARMYDSELGRWFGIDQLAEKYPQISPYAFCGNNPIRRIDTDGREWVDAKGKPMWENGKWTKYATTEFKRAGISARVTEYGRDAFDRIANGPGKTQLELSPDTKYSGKGTLVRGEHLIKSAYQTGDNYELGESKIVIYEGSIKDEISGAVSTEGDTADLIKSLPSDIATDGAIGSVLVHEMFHGSSENLKQNEANYNARKNKQQPIYDLESDPLKKQNEYLEELQKGLLK